MNNKKRKKGFGILEVLLAGVIIIIVMSAIVVLGRSSMTKTQYLQQRAEATFLAGEGIELVRQIRDTNYIDTRNDTAWNTFITLTNPPNTSGTKYYLSYSDSGHRYSLSTTVQTLDVGGTVYTRYIQFEKIDSTSTDAIFTSPAGSKTTELLNNSYIVKSTVTWGFLGQSKNIVLRELIANSRQQF